MKLIKELGLKENPNSLRNGKPRKFSWGLYECPYCGNQVERQKGKMQSSGPKSCGCLSGEKHGDHNNRLYSIWKRVKERCRNPEAPSYKYYGERGIDICDEWYNSYTVFREWALRNGYEESKNTLDRTDNDKGYNPNNCRFTSRSVQSRNTRRIRVTNKSGYRGVSWSARDKVWRATIGVDNKSIGLGQYDNKLDAAKAYDTYVILNNLEHTINGVLHEPIRLHVETFNSGS